MKQRQNTSIESCNLVTKRAKSPVVFSCLPGTSELASSRNPCRAMESSERFNSPVLARPCGAASGDQPAGARAEANPEALSDGRALGPELPIIPAGSGGRPAAGPPWPSPGGGGAPGPQPIAGEIG